LAWTSTAQQSHVYGCRRLRDGDQQQPGLCLPSGGQLAGRPEDVIAHVLGTWTSSRIILLLPHQPPMMTRWQPRHPRRRHIERLAWRRWKPSSTPVFAWRIFSIPCRPSSSHAAERPRRRKRPPWNCRACAPRATWTLHQPAEYLESSAELDGERDKPRKIPREPERDVLQFLLEHAP